MAQLSLYEQLCFSTTRIEAWNDKGQSCSGTGFFFNLQIDENHTAPLLITNKHVVFCGLPNGRFRFTEADEEGNPLPQRHFTVEITNSFATNFMPHPDSNIDLCAMPLLPIYQACDKIHKRLFFRTFDNTQIPAQDVLEKLDVVEDITMIGYPNGLWDSVNNMPLIRRGSTATHVKYDFNGKAEFVIDAACFPGSSGSPVLIVNKGQYTDKNGTVYLGKGRLVFLGIMYAGPQMAVNGDVKVVTIPNLHQQAISVSHIPNNWGYVIKAQKILDFIPLFNKK